MYDLVVIGGGPAALAATFYAASKQLDVAMVYEELGGKIGWLQSLAGPDLHAYLPGNELAHLLTIRATTQGGRSIDDCVLSVTVSDSTFNIGTARHGTLQSRTVLVATGATPLQLQVPGVAELVEGSVGYSISTYAHVVRDQSVVVVGGTARALSGAAELATSARQVYLVAPNPVAMNAPLGQALRQHPKAELLDGWEVTGVVGAHEGIDVMVERQGQARTLSVQRVFVALGLIPNSAMVRSLVKTDANGFILVNRFHETSVPGLFAAGDVSSIFGEHVLTAIGDGARAAMTAYDYLLAQRVVGCV